MTGANAKAKAKSAKASSKKTATGKAKRDSAAVQNGATEDYDVKDAERRMEKVVRAQGRLTKKGGKMVSSGISEFQVTSGDALERLVHAG